MGSSDLLPGDGLRVRAVHADPEPARAQLDARDFGADLGDLQDLPHHPGEVPRHPILWTFIAAIMVVYFGFLLHFATIQVVIIVVFSIIGILGSYGVAWFGIRINTYANSRTAFAGLKGKPFPTMAIPLKSSA
jgi:hypothetical protein